MTIASFSDYINALRARVAALEAMLERIRIECDQYADGAPDATAHDRLADTILGMCLAQMPIAQPKPDGKEQA